MKKENNPLLKKWDTPYGIPPFDQIDARHFMPAIKAAIGKANSEIEKIISNKSEPSFYNTIEALELAGKQLGLVALALFNLNSTETSKELQKVAAEASPVLTRFSNDISLNRALFEKVKHVYNCPEKENLNEEQLTLLTDRYRSFRNGGAELSGDKREHFRKISEELSSLSVKFEENVLHETNDFELHLSEKKDLEGLPQGIIEAAAEEAQSRNKAGWVFTLHAPSYIPFMQYSKVRKLRQKMLEAYSSRCYKKNDFDNRKIVSRIVNLRLELANLLGFESYAEFVLEDRMAGSSEKVCSFLEELHKRAFPYALNDLKMVREFAKKKGHKGEIERWDWAYYSEWMKRELYAIDDESLRPYFELRKVEKAVFDLATALYDITFDELKDIKPYHKDVRVYEVKDSSGGHLAILMTDYHPREGKSGGAWMTAYREQYRDGEKDIRPLVSIVMNFSKATAGKPALLTHNELTTLLHEFGHALHGMLSKCTYESNSGTNVKRDFVELPSQIMENFAYEREWLGTWAKHYKTGEIIPDELIEKLKKLAVYNEGYACNRQLGFGFLDMAWHSIKQPVTEDIGEFEDKAGARTELFPRVEGASQSSAFGHLFSGGYAAGYYGYKWAEVLDADAYEKFRENGIFDRNTAMSFKKNILEKGGSADPSKLYRAFRGADPSIDALLKRSGFTE